MLIRFEDDLHAQALPLAARLTRRFGDPELADEAVAEARLRGWRHAPRHLRGSQLQAWLQRTATNAAIDELRRRRRAPELPLAESSHAAEPEPEARLAAAAALAALTPHQRMLLLLRYEAGLSLAELGALLDLPADAARKRVARARAAFQEVLADQTRADNRPTVALLMADHDPACYVRWLEQAGARVRVLDMNRPGLDLAGADAIVLSGSHTDIHPRLYGARPHPRTQPGSLDRDLRDLSAMRIALREDVPMIGVCRGAQLLNVLFGGDLAQHVDGHQGDLTHSVSTSSGSLARTVLGRRVPVVSDHHQAVSRLGRGLRVTACAPDGTPEAVEVPGRRLALGLQWHPEWGGGEALADALLHAARAA